MTVERFDELDSTSSYLKNHYQGRPQYSVVVTGNQTAGRGQRGNSWESEPGKNLLMSMLYYPPVSMSPASQFVISKAVSLAVVDLIDECLSGSDAPDVAVKWPNDIYIGNRKVAGILIEHSLSSPGCIDHTVIGIGLNVNQRVFLSSAPNPVSLIEFCDRELDKEELLGGLCRNLEARLNRLPGEEFSAEYHSRLWRREGFHPYVALTPSSAPAPTAVRSSSAITPGSRFCAEILSVASDGTLRLRLADGSVHQFLFKELAPVLTDA